MQRERVVMQMHRVWFPLAAAGLVLLAACAPVDATPTSLPEGATPGPAATLTPKSTAAATLTHTSTAAATPVKESTLTPSPTDHREQPAPSTVAPTASTPTRATISPASPGSTPPAPAPTPTPIPHDATPPPASTLAPTPPPRDRGTGEEESGRGDRQDCTSDPSPRLTAPITDLSKIDLILPPFAISGNRFKSRSYVWIGRDANGEYYEVPVYAPADSKLVSITYYVASMQNEQGEWGVLWLRPPLASGRSRGGARSR